MVPPSAPSLYLSLNWEYSSETSEEMTPPACFKHLT